MQAQIDLIPKNASVLDIACGTGFYTSRIANHLTSGKVIGVDLSSDMLKHAQEQSPPSPNSSSIIPEYLQHDIEHPLPYSSEFDAVFALYVL